jgi:hypothetical protein
MKNKSAILVNRLLKIERLSRELAELITDHVCQANDGESPETRQQRMVSMWSEIVRHVGVVENTSRAAAPDQPSAALHGRN